MAPLPAGAQVQRDLGTFSAIQWTMQDGLPTNVVRSLAEDPEGFLWIGTLSGLVRFDGVQFTLYNLVNTPDLGGIQIRKLLFDDHGDLWVWPDERRIVVRRAGRFLPVVTGQYGAVTDMVLGPDDDVFVGTVQGLIRCRGDSIASFTAVGNVRSLQVDPDGRLWVLMRWVVGAAHTQLLCFEGTREVFREQVPGASWILTAWDAGPGVVVHGADTLVYASLDGIRRVPVTRGVAAPALAAGRNQVGEWFPEFLFTDRTGCVWLGAGSGLFRSPSGTMTPDRPVLPAAERVLDRDLAGMPRCIFEDGEGDVWVGTELHGLFRITPAVTAPLSSPAGWSVAGTHLERYPHLNWLLAPSSEDPRSVKVLRNLEGTVVRSLDPLGPDVWLVPGAPSEAGTLLRDDRSRIVFHDGVLKRVDASGTHPGALRHLVPRDGDYWFCDRDTLFAVSASGLRVVTAPCDQVLGRTAGGAWWYLSGGRLHRRQDDEDRTYGAADGLPPGPIRDLWESPEGRVWLGLHGSGLAAWTSAGFRVATTRNGLPDNTVGGILSDGRGRVWINSNRGVFTVPEAALERFATGAANDVPSRLVTRVESASNWAARDGRGRLYFDTFDGVVFLETDKVRGPEAAPGVTVDEIRYNDVGIAPSPGIRLPRGVRSCAVAYTAPSLGEAELVRFRYRLRDLDRAWTEAGTRRTAYFTHLPPGRHRFEVVAANSAGDWSDAVTAVAFTVPPFVHETLWFRALLLGAVIASVVLVMRARANQKLRHLAAVEAESERAHRAETGLRRMGRRLLGAQEEERRRIARELHDDVNQRLAVLAMELDMMDAGSGRPPAELAADVQALSRDVHRISHALHPGRIEQIGLVKALEGLCVELSAGEGPRITFQAGGIPDTVPVTASLCIFRIAQEAIRNAMKYSESPAVRVFLRAGDGDLVLDVVDTGKGFDPSEAAAAGLGLTSMAERAGAAGGRVTVESAPDTGTTVRAVVPLGEKGRP